MSSTLHRAPDFYFSILPEKERKKVHELCQQKMKLHEDKVDELYQKCRDSLNIYQFEANLKALQDL